MTQSYNQSSIKMVRARLTKAKEDYEKDCATTDLILWILSGLFITFCISVGSFLFFLS